MTLIAAADGSALGNPGAAGWAWYIDDSRWRTGGWDHATNNQAELMAVLSLLQETASTDEPLLIQCDSQYVINALTKWLTGWKRKGWKKADGKPVMNRDLLEQLDRELTHRNVSFEWVKGHAGHPLNEQADSIAQATARAFQAGTSFEAGPGFEYTTNTLMDIPAPPVQEEAPALFDASLFQSEPMDTVAPNDQVIELERFLLGITANEGARFVERLSADSVFVDAHGTVVTGREAVAKAIAVGDAPPSIEPVSFTTLGPETIHLLYRTPTDPVLVCSSIWIQLRGAWIRSFHQQTRQSER